MDDAVEAYLTDLARAEHDEPVLVEMEARAAEHRLPDRGSGHRSVLGAGRSFRRCSPSDRTRLGLRLLGLLVRPCGGLGRQGHVHGWGPGKRRARGGVPDRGGVVGPGALPRGRRAQRTSPRNRASSTSCTATSTSSAIRAAGAQDRDRIRVGGLWLCDNVIWSGHVATGTDREGLPGWTAAITEHNRLVAGDSRYVGSIVPIRDGVMTALRVR